MLPIEKIFFSWETKLRKTSKLFLQHIFISKTNETNHHKLKLFDLLSLFNWDPWIYSTISRLYIIQYIFAIINVKPKSFEILPYHLIIEFLFSTKHLSYVTTTYSLDHNVLTKRGHGEHWSVSVIQKPVYHLEDGCRTWNGEKIRSKRVESAQGEIYEKLLIGDSVEFSLFSVKEI